MSTSIKNKKELDIDNVGDVRSKEYLEEFYEINNYFDIIDKIGEGSFASVFTVRSKQVPDLKEKFALKFTIPTIYPKRIENELRILKKIGGRKNVVKLHFAFRIKDHIFMLMPFVDHKKFVDYYLTMGEKEIRDYLRNLLIALSHVHENKIIHRDVKPNNFLYDRSKKRFTLIDFGLAHSESHGDLGAWFDDDSLNGNGDQKVFISNIETSNTTRVDQHSQKQKLSDSSSINDNITSATTTCVCGNRLTTCIGCRNKPRPQVRRGGTIGYRPPEVMMRHVEQTVAVDVWAVGIIFAIFLTGQYPFVKGDDDLDVFYTLTYFLSLERMQSGARAIERRIIMNPKPKPLIGSIKEWLKSRCTFIRKQSSKLNKLNDVNEFNDSAYDLLSLLLDPNMHTRITCKNALQHSFFR